MRPFPLRFNSLMELVDIENSRWISQMIEHAEKQQTRMTETSNQLFAVLEAIPTRIVKHNPDDSIEFIDAFGVSVFFPMGLCRTWEVRSMCPLSLFYLMK